MVGPQSRRDDEHAELGESTDSVEIRSSRPTGFANPLQSICPNQTKPLEHPVSHRTAGGGRRAAGGGRRAAGDGTTND
jgi:hypothetical protein